MDAKHPTPSAWLCSLALVYSLAQISPASAEEAIASDAEPTSTIFITDDSVSAPPSPPTSVEGSLVFIEDTSPPSIPSAAKQPTANVKATIVQPLPPTAGGELKVVSNPTRTDSTHALRPLPQQLPLEAKPAKLQSTIQKVAALEPVAADRDQPGDIQIAVHAEPIAQPEAPATVETQSVDQLLISAHRRSAEARSTADYTDIAKSCAAALRQGVKGDKRHFARQLSAWALNRRGQLRADGGEKELADADFQAALEFNPKNWRALHNRGVSFAQSGSFAEAFDDFNAVIQINPMYAKAYANRATLYVQAKDLQAAIKDYEQAIQRDEDFATAYVGLGRVCHMLGRWDEAIEHFTAAIQLEPASPDIVCSRGDLHADMGRYGEALTDYARTIELDPDFAHAYRNGAWLLATCPDKQFRDPENAVLGARQALDRSYGERHVALDTLAAALASNGQFDEAIATVKQAVDLAPEDAKFTYISRLQLYQEQQPFRTEPAGEVSQAVYESNDE